MADCQSKLPGATDYCSCSWDQILVLFKAAQDNPQPNEDDMKTRIRTACADKLPEATIKKQYVDSCVDDKGVAAAYCECSWTSLRKTLSLADFVSPEQQAPRLVDARKSVTKECKAKLPAGASHTIFTEACVEGDATKAKACECIWKKVTAKYSNDDILASAVDMSTVPGIAECQALRDGTKEPKTSGSVSPSKNDKK